ncbi:MAG: GxxExxY protein [Prevotella sp.]|jgi:GxxExxY protein|nr:GxxExxY protein [Prevotella sp.]
MRDYLDRDYTHKLLGCAYAVHSALGPGLLESIYEKALCYELQSQGFEVRNQVPVKVKYRDISLDLNLQLDIIVDNSVILELKSVAELLPVHKKQLLTYMRLTGTKLGYIINFNEYSLKDGIERIVNDFW